MDSRAETLEEAPTATQTPRLSEKKLDGDAENKQDGVAITATNTRDTLTDSSATPVVAPEDQPAPGLASASKARKIALLSMFVLAEFMDAFNNSALFPAIPNIASQLQFDASEVVWIISAYQLTFAAFLLLSGRISDVYTPKPAFVSGAFILGATHLGGGFARQKIVLLVLRALGGIGGALTIPSALSLIVQLFPNPAHQATAIALFGSAGAIGNIIGVLLGAVLVQYASWGWIFWFVAIVGIGIAAICLFLIPNAERDRTKKVKFDVFGVTILTVAVILFIFAVTSGSPKGWGTAYVLAPLVISLAITVVFLWWEARIHPDDAVLPPRMWRYRNFGVLVTLALLPYLWWVTSFVNLVSWWEAVYGWTAIDTAVHFLPMGISAGIISLVAGRFVVWFAHKWIILAGLSLSIIATILLPFADAPSTYWSFSFPAFIIGSIGTMIIFANSSIAIFSYTPPHVAGTVGAVFNSALQLGSAVGLAAVSSLTTSIDAKSSFEPPLTEWSQHLDQITSSMWKDAYKGRSSAYWFLLGILLLLATAVILFFKVDLPVHEEKPVEKTDIEAVSEKN